MMNEPTADQCIQSSRFRREICRRTFLARAGTSVGALALATLSEPDLRTRGDTAAPAASPVDGPWPGVVRPLHFAPRAKRVIYLYMAGGPSHLETFDYKPKLAEMNGQPMPESFTKGQPIAQLQGAKLNCLAPQHPFVRCGKSGQEISSVFPLLGEVADEMCIIRSLHTDAINHDPAHTFMNTGTTISGRPSMGAWLTYGLGSDSADLPGFVVMTSPGQIRPGAADRGPHVAQRLLAQPVSGGRVSLEGGRGPLPGQSAGGGSRAAGGRGRAPSAR